MHFLDTVNVAALWRSAPCCEATCCLMQFDEKQMCSIYNIMKLWIYSFNKKTLICIPPCSTAAAHFLFKHIWLFLDNNSALFCIFLAFLWWASSNTVSTALLFKSLPELSLKVFLYWPLLDSYDNQTFYFNLASVFSKQSYTTHSQTELPVKVGVIQATKLNTISNCAINIHFIIMSSNI